MMQHHLILLKSSWANVLAYLGSSSSNKEKKFKTFMSGEFYAIKRFYVLVYRYRVRPGAYPREDHVIGTALKGRFLALPANIRLGCKALPGTNNLAYYEHL
jgi:hypothetical protein